jgi:alkylhydroperoxidase family enzyme
MNCETMTWPMSCSLLECSPYRPGARVKLIDVARIEPVDPAQTSDKVRAALDSLPPLNIFRTLAHAETAFRPFLRFGGAVLGELALDPLVRELAILTVAKEAEAEYEWAQHVAIAKTVGATDAQINALAKADSCATEGADERIAQAARRDAEGEAYPFTGAQQAAIELAAAVVRGPRISDDVFDCIRAQFSDREIVELLLTIGDYLMLARLMTVLEIDLDEPGGAAILSGLRDRAGDSA